MSEAKMIPVKFANKDGHQLFGIQSSKVKSLSLSESDNFIKS